MSRNVVGAFYKSFQRGGGGSKHLQFISTVSELQAKEASWGRKLIKFVSLRCRWLATVPVPLWQRGQYADMHFVYGFCTEKGGGAALVEFRPQTKTSETLQRTLKRN